MGPDWLESLGAGAAGAASGVLFDIPEAIAKAVDKKSFEDWKARNATAYGAGQLAGTIGGSFIPVAGLVGKGLKVLGGAGKLAEGTNLLSKAGQGLEKLASAPAAGANFGQIASHLGQRAAVESALGEGVRSAAHGDDLGTIGTNALTSGALGGVVGGLAGGGLSQAGKLLQEFRKGTRLADLERMGYDTKSLRNALRQTFKQFGGGQTSSKGAALKSTKLDDMLDQIQETTKAAGGRGEIDKGDIAEQLYSKAKEGYGALDDLAEANQGVIHKAISEKAISDNASKFPGRPELENNLNDLISRLEKTPSLSDKRALLQNAVIKGSRGNDTDLFDAATSLRNNLDSAVNDIAENSGNQSLKELGKQWKVANSLGDAEIRGDLAMQKGTGSSTNEKAILAGALGIGGAGAAGASSDWSDPSQIGANLGKTLLAGLGGAALAKGAAKAKTVGMSALDDVLKGALTNGGKVIQKIEQSGSVGGPALGRSVAGAVNQATTQQKQEIAANPQALAQVAEVNKTAHADLVKARLRQIWDTRFASQFKGEDAFNQFLAGAEQASRGFDPERTASLIYPDQADREAYLAALHGKKAIESNLAQSGEKAGPFGLLGQTQEAKLAESALESAATDSMKLSGIDSKTATAAVKGILSGGGSLGEKKQKLLAILQKFNPQGFDALKGAGLA